MAWCVSLGLGLRVASSGCAKLRVLRRPRPVLTPRRRARELVIEIAFQVGVVVFADVVVAAAAAMPKRCRSKGVVRAAKRRAFTLRSQNLPDDDALAAPTTRGDRIAEAMKRGSSDAAAAWPDCDAWRPKSLFEVYYKLQRVVERHDWCAPVPHTRRPRPNSNMRSLRRDPHSRRLEPRELIHARSSAFAARRECPFGPRLR